MFHCQPQVAQYIFSCFERLPCQRTWWMEPMESTHCDRQCDHPMTHPEFDQLGTSKPLCALLFMCVTSHLAIQSSGGIRIANHWEYNSNGTHKAKALDAWPVQLELLTKLWDCQQSLSQFAMTTCVSCLNLFLLGLWLLHVQFICVNSVLANAKCDANSLLLCVSVTDARWARDHASSLEQKNNTIVLA